MRPVPLPLLLPDEGHHHPVPCPHPVPPPQSASNACAASGTPQCIYQKLVQAVVNPYMSREQFKSANIAQAFLDAVTATASLD